MHILKLNDHEENYESIEKTVKFYQSYEAFSKLTNEPESILKIQLEPGTLILIDNFRVFHGRTAFNVIFKRF